MKLNFIAYIKNEGGTLLPPSLPIARHLAGFLHKKYRPVRVGLSL